MRGKFSPCRHRSAWYCRVKFNEMRDFVRAAKTTCVRTGLKCACLSSLRALIPHDWIISAQSRRLQAPRTEVQRESWRNTAQTAKNVHAVRHLSTRSDSSAQPDARVIGGLERAEMSALESKFLYSPVKIVADGSRSSYVMRGQRTRISFWKKKKKNLLKNDRIM